MRQESGVSQDEEKEDAIANANRIPEKQPWNLKDDESFNVNPWTLDETTEGQKALKDFLAGGASPRPVSK